MTESNLHRVCRQHLGPFGILKRIENRLGDLGMPDTLYCFRPKGATGWLELKQLANLPARPAVPISIPHLTIEQVLWQEAWIAAGGRCHTFLQAGRGYYLLDVPTTRAVYERKVMAKEIVNRALVTAFDEFPTKGLLRCLAT